LKFDLLSFDLLSLGLNSFLDIGFLLFDDLEINSIGFFKNRKKKKKEKKEKKLVYNYKSKTR